MTTTHDATDVDNDAEDDLREVPEKRDEAAEAREKLRGKKAHAESTKEATVSPSAWSRNRWTWVAAALMIGAVTAGTFGVFKYRSATAELTSVRQAQTEHDAVSKVADDYAMKSLTYTYNDPDAFFRSVQDGVSPVLKEKYVNAQELLKAIMLQAQVTSSGEILSTEAVSQPGGVYQVTVTANQLVRNLQNPEPRVSNIVLQITMNKVGDKWQVSDIGPRTGTHAPSMGTNAVPQAPAVLDKPAAPKRPSAPLPQLPALPGR